jgi:hypothetical protein
MLFHFLTIRTIGKYINGILALFTIKDQYAIKGV